MAKPAHLPFHLLAWGQRYLRLHNCQQFYYTDKQLPFGDIAAGTGNGNGYDNGLGAGSNHADGAKVVRKGKNIYQSRKKNKNDDNKKRWRGRERRLDPSVGQLESPAGASSTRDFAAGDAVVGQRPNMTSSSAGVDGVTHSGTRGMSSGSSGSAISLNQLMLKAMYSIDWNDLSINHHVNYSLVPEDDVYDICRPGSITNSFGGPINVTYVQKNVLSPTFVRRMSLYHALAAKEANEAKGGDRDGGGDVGGGGWGPGWLDAHQQQYVLAAAAVGSWEIGDSSSKGESPQGASVTSVGIST